MSIVIVDPEFEHEWEITKEGADLQEKWLADLGDVSPLTKELYRALCEWGSKTCKLCGQHWGAPNGSLTCPKKQPIP